TPPSFPAACPRCQRYSNFYVGYLNQSVRCRHCRHVFCAQPRDAQSISQTALTSDWFQYLSLLQPELASLPETQLPPR
ncbi:MAG: hypothetical protein ACKO0N_18100, partial [Planctomycetota bacterium]